MFEFLQQFQWNPAELQPVQIAFSLILAISLTTLMAAVYEYSHKGLSYSESFVQSLVLGGIISAVLMMAIGNSLARGVGLMGTMAIVRFRSTMRDPRDMIFMFAALAVGIASGVGLYIVAFIGTIFFVAVAFLFTYYPMGKQTLFDGLIRFRVDKGDYRKDDIHRTMSSSCRKTVLVTMRDDEGEKDVEFVYHIRLRRGKSRDTLLSQLRSVPGLKGLSFHMHEGATLV